MEQIDTSLGNNCQQASVLVVEDNIDEHLIMQYLLRQHFKEILPIGATTANQALAYLENCQATDSPLPSLILLDLYLPKPEQGWWLLQQIRHDAKYQSLPVVVISRSTNRGDVEQSYRWGANSYIPKPQNPEGWVRYFQTLRRYWLDMVALPTGTIVASQF